MRFLTCTALALATTSAFGGSYHLTVIGPTDFVALGVNSFDQAAGSSIAFPDLHAFVYAGGGIQDLGTLGGRDSYATALNDLGQVVGDSDIAVGSPGRHAFLSTGGAPQDLGTLGGVDSHATAINDAGTVVGYSLNSQDNYDHAFVYSGGTMHALDPDDFFSRANGINSGGTIVGQISSVATGGYGHAFRTLAGGGMQDLGTLGGNGSSATAINDVGQIVGVSNTPGDLISSGFIYSGGVMQSLNGGSFSVPTGIDDAGEAVGFYSYSQYAYHAFLYANGSFQDLNSLLDASGAGYTLTQATGISRNGLIVAVGTDTLTNSRHSFLITPVPEPATFASLGVGALALLRRRRGQG